MREGAGLLFLLRMQVGSDHQPLNGEVEDEWSDGSIKHCAGQELISQVDGEEIGLTGSVQPVGRDTHNAANTKETHWEDILIGERLFLNLTND